MAADWRDGAARDREAGVGRAVRAAVPLSCRIAVLASGRGSNLQALLDRFPPDGGPAGGAVSLVVSDREGAGALDRASAASIPGRVVVMAGRPEAESAVDLLGLLDDDGIDVVALAGFLRRVPGAVVSRFRRRMLNIHPALLPAFGGKGMYGLHVHRAVLAAGCRVSGATVHFVDEEYDTGRILVQWPVPVLAGDSPERLAARVLQAEHVIYPEAVEAVVTHLSTGAPSLGGAGLAESAGFRLEDVAAAPDPAAVRRMLGLQ